MAELRARDGIAAAALEFLILTGARVGEVRLAQWDQIDLEEAVWNVPQEIMKAGRAHRVPPLACRDCSAQGNAACPWNSQTRITSSVRRSNQVFCLASKSSGGP
ncbi:MAG: tyrosine-type recombinase/integrase [Sphingobium sp.]